ncbi:AIR synthase related protein [Neomoorella thermoacetica]|uniref:AIR synthase related protein n=1 Tax=Neomoorella thermoacetica TaxID=1525 RepID=UPI0030CD8CAB
MTPATLSPRRYRDLTILDLDEQRSLVIACDSAGAIGPKEADVVRVPGYVLGRFTARVALMEVLAIGAWPVCIVNTLCVEPEPAGAAIREGVADEMRVLGIDPEKALTGSSEKNIPTTQSGIGITVIGLATTAELLTGRLAAGDTLALFGRPKVGTEVFLDDPEIVDLKTVRLLLDQPGIREIVPAGSRGILAEARDLAALYGLQINWRPGLTEPALLKSAGPATCILAAGDRAALETTGRRAEKPFCLLGTLGPAASR